jgi:uncharacterized lipoprotein
MNAIRTVFAGFAVAATLLLSACSAKLDEESARELVDRIHTASEVHDAAKVGEMLAPDFKATFVTPQGRVSMSRDEMLAEVGKPAVADENRTAALAVGDVTLDPAANRATVNAVNSSEFTMQGHRMLVIDDHTYVVELRDGKLVLVSLAARMKTMSMDGTKVY